MEIILVLLLCGLMIFLGMTIMLAMVEEDLINKDLAESRATFFARKIKRVEDIIKENETLNNPTVYTVKKLKEELGMEEK